MITSQNPISCKGNSRVIFQQFNSKIPGIFKRFAAGGPEETYHEFFFRDHHYIHGP